MTRLHLASCVLFGIVFLAGFLYLGVSLSNKKPVLARSLSVVPITIGSATILAEVADTPVLRERGLSGRSRLAPEAGMLFVFDENGKPAFWMKDMTFLIDIIWIGEDKKIVDITENFSPDSYPNTTSSQSPVRYVLEVNAGFAALHGVKVGDDIILPNRE